MLKKYIIIIRFPDMMIKKTLYQLISHKIDRIYHRCPRCIKQLRRLQRPVSRRPCRIDLPKSWTTGGSTRCWTPGIFIMGKHHQTTILQNVGPPVCEIAKLVNTSPRTMVYGVKTRVLCGQTIGIKSCLLVILDILQQRSHIFPIVG